MAITVDVVSDVVCPWCFVGKRRLEKAIAALDGKQEVRVRWHPYQLNPQMPKEGMDRRAYRTAKFGSWERSLALDAQIKTVGESEGLVFAPEKCQRTPNTLDAHRLIWLAEKEGVQDAVVEALFRAYFTEGKDIGDTPTLLDVVAGAGLNRERAEAVLNSDEGLATIREEDEQARTVGVQGVPFFIINDAIVLSGAREPSAFLEAFEQASEESVASTEGNTCGIGAKGAC